MLTRGAPGAGRGSSRGRSGCRTSRCARRGGSRGSRSWRASGRRAGQQRCMRWAGELRPCWRWEERARNAGLFSASPPLSRPVQSQPITTFPRLRPRSDHQQTPANTLGMPASCPATLPVLPGQSTKVCNVAPATPLIPPLLFAVRPPIAHPLRIPSSPSRRSMYERTPNDCRRSKSVLDILLGYRVNDRSCP